MTEYLAVLRDGNVFARLPLPRPAGAMMMSGPRLFVTGAGTPPTLMKLDLANPAKPQLVWTRRLGQHAAGNLAAGPGDVVYVAETGSGFVITR